MPAHGRLYIIRILPTGHAIMREMHIFALIFLLASSILAQVPEPKPKTAIPVKPPAVPAQPFDKVVLTVGDEKMTIGEFEKFVETLPDQYRVQARGPAKRQVV